MSLTRIMRHPLAIVSGIGIGIAVGVWSPAVTPAMRAIGDGYLLLFKMCVAPILISLITAAIARITGLPESARLVRRIAIVFPIAMVLVSAFGALVGVVMGPGRSLTAAARSSLGVVLGAQQNTFTMPLFSTAASDDAPPGAVAFFHTIVPANVFAALSSDAALQIIFVAVIFGASLGYASAARKAVLIDFFEGVFEAFQTIIDRLMLFLPLGLIALTAASVGEFNSSTIGAMSRFVLAATIVLGGVTAIAVVIVWRRQGGRLIDAYVALRHTLIFAFATQNSFASLPSAMEALRLLGFSDDVADLVGPLAITTCRLGAVGYIAVSSVFVAQIYGAALGPSDLVLIVVGSVIAGLATAGTTGVVQLSLIGVVLALVHVPFDAALILFVSMDVIANPLRTISTVAGGMATAVLIERTALQPEAILGPTAAAT